jgi:hypothetical protein
MIANLPYEPTGDAVAPGPWAQAPRQPQVNADANVVNGVAMLLDDAGADFPPGLRAGRPLDRQRRTRELVKLVGMILGFMREVVKRQFGLTGRPPMTLEQTAADLRLPIEAVKSMAVQAHHWLNRPDIVARINGSLQEIART